MSIDVYEMREEMLDLRQKLLKAEDMRLAGCESYSIEEVSELILQRNVIIK
jgi:hypothetical protein